MKDESAVLDDYHSSCLQGDKYIVVNVELEVPTETKFLEREESPNWLLENTEKFGRVLRRQI